MCVTSCRPCGRWSRCTEGNWVIRVINVPTISTEELTPSLVTLKRQQLNLKEWGEGQVRADEQGGREEQSETQQGRMKILASDSPLPLVVRITTNHAVCFLTCVAGLSSRQHCCENGCDRNIPQIWGPRQGTKVRIRLKAELFKCLSLFQAPEQCLAQMGSFNRYLLEEWLAE